MEKRTISVEISCFGPKFEMIIEVPDNCDAEDYIGELLESIFKEDLWYNAEWYFVDGLSG